MSNKYSLDYAVHPGEYIEELLESNEMTQTDLAIRMHISTKHLNQIIKGKANISPTTALALEAVLDRPAQYWISLQAKYDEFNARKEQEATLLTDTDWISSFDYSFLAAENYVEQTRSLVEKGNNLLRFFQVASVDAWKDVWVFNARNIYCRSAAHTDSDVKLETYAGLASWIRIGQLQGEPQVWDYPVFHSQKLSRAIPSLRAITFLSNPEEIVAAVSKQLKGAGVLVQYVKPIKGMRTYAASFMIRSGQVACIQLSGRGKTGDQLFFSLFHEINHLLNRETSQGFLIGATKDSNEENDADGFAGDLLIPPQEYANFLSTTVTADSILAFSEKIRIHPGIVVGRLQHEKKIEFSQFNHLKIAWK